MLNDVKIDEKLLQESIKVNDINTKSIVSMEECAELIQAISKIIRGDKTYSNLVEEIADVYICLETLIDMYNIDTKEIQKIVRFKQIRQKTRDMDRLNIEK